MRKVFNIKNMPSFKVAEIDFILKSKQGGRKIAELAKKSLSFLGKTK
jgi:hypothetical protein